MVDIARLGEALKNADAAGDTEAATKFATAIRSAQASGEQAPQPDPNINPSSTSEQSRVRRATEGQSVPQPNLSPGPDADPLADIPTEINGVELRPDERQAMLEGKSLEDPKERRLLSARLAGRIARRSKDGNLADQFLASQFGAGARGFTNLFGLGDLAAAGGQFVGSQLSDSEDKLSFGEALEMQQEFRRAGEEDFPLTAGLSEVAGAIVTGGGLAKLAQKGLVKAAPALASKVGGVLALQKGQKLKNVAKVASLGATEGAITEGITEDNALGGAALGAVGGPAGLGLAKMLGIPIQAFAKGLARARIIDAAQAKQMLKTPAGKSLEILAKKLGVSSEDLALTFRRFEALTGKPPSLAELANKDVGLEIKNLLEASGSATRTAQDLAETTLSTRADEIGQQVATTARRGSKQAEELKRTAVARKQFAKADNDQIKFSQREVADLLNDPDLRRAMPPTLKRRIDDLLDLAKDGPVTLSGLDVNDLRQALRGKGRDAVGADQIFNELADELEGIARPQSENFARALDEFAARSRRGEGIAGGKKVLSEAVTENKASVNALRDAQDQAGFRVGARTALADTASEGVGQAKGLVDKLVTDSGLTKRLEKILPAREVAKIKQIARVQKDALDRLGSSVPATRANDGVDLLPPLVNAIVVAGPTSGASKVLSAGRILQTMKKLVGIKANDKLMEQIAKDFFDPKRSKLVIKQLRDLGAKDEDILSLFITASGGTAATENLLN